MEFVAKRRYAYMGIPYFHFDVFERTYRTFRQACEAEGYEADPLQCGVLAPIYVSDTDASARAEYEEHFWYFRNRLLPGLTVSPPGYFSARSLPGVLKGGAHFITAVKDWDDVVSGRYAIVGSPDTVFDQLAEATRRIGAGNLLGLFQLGTLSGEATRQNLSLFAEHVMPRLRAEFPEGRPILDKNEPGARGVPEVEVA
jgi:alkanesulfonate monooxygenase SsuD/methylene tetrahydromethanopterin reductase-like flavin-dependent oxidoreductase (luciferase family)